MTTQVALLHDFSALWDTDNLVDDTRTLWQSPANNCHFVNQNVPTDRCKTDEFARGLYTKTVTEVVSRKYTLITSRNRKMTFPKEEAKVMKSRPKISSLQIWQELGTGKRTLQEMQNSKKYSPVVFLILKTWEYEKGFKIWKFNKETITGS